MQHEDPNSGGPMTQGWNLPPPTFFYPISHLPHPNFPPPTSNFEKMTSHISGILRIEFQKEYRQNIHMKVTENQKLTNTVVLFKFFMKFSSISSESLKVLGYGHYSWLLIEYRIYN